MEDLAGPIPEMNEARQHGTRDDCARAEKLGKRMESIAVGLHRDPQLELVLRRRAPELALSMERGRLIGKELAQSASPTALRAIVAAARIVTANREAIERCSKAAVRARETTPCTIKVGVGK